MTKVSKKIAAVFMAVIMAFAFSAFGSFAPAQPAYAAGTGTITVTPPDTATGSNTYTVYKVFDAEGNGTNISYKLVSGKTTAPAGFTVDEAGNVSYTGSGTNGELTADDISAIKDYVTDADKVGTITTDGTTAGTLKDVPNGYYYITTTTGSLVTVTSTNPDQSVKDKNTVTSVDDKKVTDVSEDGSKTNDGHTAIAELGSTVSFQADVTFGKGAKNVKFHDTMTDGLTLDPNSIKVTGLPEGATYEVLDTPDQGDTFTISFSDGIAENTKVTITYNATVTSGELTKDPATNKAHTSYGDNDNTTSDKEVKVYNATVTVAKTFTGGTINEGDSAQFVLQNSEKKYYKNVNGDVSWVDNVNDATKLTFTQNGSQTFTGLDNGIYTLTESKVPAGFTKAADQTITINGADSTDEGNRAQTENIENKAGFALPSTGGMGTTVLYALGAILVIGAGALLIARRKQLQK